MSVDQTGENVDEKNFCDVQKKDGLTGAAVFGTQELETKRLVLRQFSENDAEKMFENWASDPLVTKYLTWKTHASPKETKAIIREWTEGYDRADFFQWAIVLKETDEPIGSISVVNIDEKSGDYEIGYCIGRRLWNMGITTEALEKVIAFLFDEIKAKSVSAKHCAENIPSGKVMGKCGLRYVGTQKGAAKTGEGETYDLVCRSLLREEYEKRL